VTKKILAKFGLAISATLMATAPLAFGQTRITAWVENTPLPEADATAAAAHGSTIVVLTRSNAYVGNVNAAGTITGWTRIDKPPGFPTPTSLVVVGDSLLYVSYPNSYIADFLPGGTLSTWRQAPGVNPRLWGADGGNSAATDGTYVWSIGGCCGGTVEPRLSTVDVATVVNGTVSAWRSLADFPIPIQSAGVSVINGYLYVYGGLNNYGYTIFKDVRRAPILPGGNLGPWQSAGSLLEQRPTSGFLLYQDTLHIISSHMHDFYQTPTVETVLAVNLGNTGRTVYSAPLPVSRGNFGTAVVRNLGFVIGGCLFPFCSAQTNSVLTAVLGPADTGPKLLAGYASNLHIGDGAINITNTGALGAGLQSGTAASITGTICANVYAFSPDQQMLSCCSCPVTPNGLRALSATRDLVSNGLPPATPTAIAIKLLGTVPSGGSCANSAANLTTLTQASGLVAWGTGVHSAATPPPAGQQSGPFTITEHAFLPATLSAGELSRLSTLCNFILANGTGYGVCRSCQLGGLGAGKQ
jgi:hypothetical protein